MTHYVIDDGRYGLMMPLQKKYPFDNPVNYLSFRYNNFLGDLSNNSERKLLLYSLTDDHFDDLVNLFKVENMMFQYERVFNPDSVIANKIIRMSQTLQEQVKGSRRLDYILATTYLVKGEDVKAMPVYDKLIGENYYALPCLKKYYKVSKGKKES